MTAQMAILVTVAAVMAVGAVLWLLSSSHLDVVSSAEEHPSDR